VKRNKTKIEKQRQRPNKTIQQNNRMIKSPNKPKILHSVATKFSENLKGTPSQKVDQLVGLVEVFSPCI